MFSLSGENNSTTRTNSRGTPQGQYWCFTYNNPTHYPEELGALLVNINHFRYAVFQLEEGEETKTKHYQGYLECAKNVRRSYLTNMTCDKISWRKRRGTQKEARDYCMKEDTRLHGPYEFGTFVVNKQGRRTDLIKLRDSVLNRTPLNEVVPTVLNNQQLRFVQGLSSYVPLSHKYVVKKVYWLWGATGVGKTLTAMTACPEGNTWMSNGTGQWFDGYIGQTHVIIDEFRAKNWPYDLMLKLLDGYELNVPIKGGFTRWYPKVIYITAPMPPNECYFRQLQHHGSIAQLLRRITEIRHIEHLQAEDDGLPTDEDNESDDQLGVDLTNEESELEETQLPTNYSLLRASQNSGYGPLLFNGPRNCNCDSWPLCIHSLPFGK